MNEYFWNDMLDPNEAFQNQRAYRWDLNGIFYSILLPWPAQQVALQMLDIS